MRKIFIELDAENSIVKGIFIFRTIFMSQHSIFNPSVEPLIKLLTYTTMAVFVILTLLNWTDFEQYSALWLFRFFSLAILTFLAGTLFGLSLVLKVDSDSYSLNTGGIVWGSLLVLAAGFGVILLQAKAGVFIAGLLFLVLWQVELKSNLARAYPEWLWVLRTKASMVIAMCHILLWMTVGL